MFESYRDSELNGIVSEGQEMTLSFQKTGPTTATVSWTIPAASSDCNEDGRNAYNGIVITVNNSPATLANSPVNGTYYQGDPSTNAMVHVGDVINGSLVVGAFYDDRTTTSLNIVDLQANTPYFVSGYAVDNVARYHTAGIHAYSLEYGNGVGSDTSGYQIITLGVQPTDSTSLVPADTYLLQIDIDGTCYDINIPGSSAQTYQDLVDFIQQQISLLTTTVQSSGYPNIGYLYIDATGKLSIWNGQSYDSKILINHPTDPTLVVPNSYWLNNSTNTMSQHDGTIWNSIIPISYYKDPQTIDCSDYWYNGSIAYSWSGSVWVPLTIFNQAIDPILPPVLACPLFWFDSGNEFFYEWNEITKAWESKDVASQITDPSILVTNDYWFSIKSMVLNQWDGSNWVIMASSYTNVEPVSPTNGDGWVNSDTNVLSIYDGLTMSWVVTAVIIWDTDPNAISAGDVWWNTATNVVSVWDIISASWILSNFITSATDPSSATVIAIGDGWIDSNTILRVWDGDSWLVVNTVYYATDPRIIALNDYWNNSTTSEWFVWTGSWTLLTFINYYTDPLSPTIGDYWYDGTALQVWGGVSWMVVMFNTIDITPAEGFIYYDTSIPGLLRWGTGGWVTFSPLATIVFNATNDIEITSSTTGSSSVIAIQTTLTTLLAALNPVGTLSGPSVGTDSLQGTPSYQQIGVGDDGTIDERRELIDSMRAQLGYPTVEVELTKYQWDQCLNGAIESLRKRSSIAYKREYFFMNAKPNQQIYDLTNRTTGFHTIADVTRIYRGSNSIFSGVGGYNATDQLLLQQVYGATGFDLVSFHLMHQYLEVLKHVTAYEILFQWDEDLRKLYLSRRIYQNERLLLDCVVERTEQNMIKDRFLKSWIEKFAISQARLILAEIRGKYSSIAGPNGGTILNSSDLTQRAEIDMADCMQQLDEYVAEKPEDWGMAATFVIG